MKGIKRIRGFEFCRYGIGKENNFNRNLVRSETSVATKEACNPNKLANKPYLLESCFAES